MKREVSDAVLWTNERESQVRRDALETSHEGKRGRRRHIESAGHEGMGKRERPQSPHPTTRKGKMYETKT